MTSIFRFIVVAIGILILIRPYPRIHLEKTIEFQHQNGEVGDVLFSLFSQLGVSVTIDRAPVINIVGNSKFIDYLTRTFSERFPMVLHQFRFVIESKSKWNAELDSPYEDPMKFTEYATPSIVVKGNGFQNYLYFDHLRPEIRQWMLGDAENIVKARSLFVEKLDNSFQICVHTNGKHLKAHVFGVKWLLEKYSQDHSHISVVVWNDPTKTILESEDLQNLKFNKHSIPSNSPSEVQLTFSRLYCNAVLLAEPSSTFGFWIGYLAKKEDSPVYYRQVAVDTFFPPEWISLEF